VRILADENFPGDAVTALRERGHDVAWVRSDAPGSSDAQVIARAQVEGRVLITFDKDFGELTFRVGLLASSGIVSPLAQQARGLLSCAGLLYAEMAIWRGVVGERTTFLT
jgi:hypothetical protein